MPAWFYGVRVGRTPGVYDTWYKVHDATRASCEEQIHSFSAAKFKKFSNRTDAENYAYGVQANRTPLTPRAAAVSAPLPVAGPSNFRPQPVNGNSDTDVIYTDGSCKGNGKITAVAGIGVWWGENDTRNISERCPGDQTNNRAELIAIIRALESTPHSKRSLVIKTDSQYAINCLDVWIQGWKNRGWRTADGGPVKNKIVIQYLESLLQLRQKRGQKVRIKHVRGHSGIPGNDAADFEANKGTLYPEVPERDWRGLTAAVKAEISAIDGMPVDENESDDLDSRGTRSRNGSRKSTTDFRSFNSSPS
ncbi:hypothetical protein BD410DRAFT_815295 [Rickenella mellea]|uniref:ribonuclease H n=1 Tax=Rickenella mellea TaxID=50990 RepID=A0A4Y7Q2W7_9AGAM|nr:hypothetical protein BD410DRAFT_815295 [Rickenella mellea]